LGARVPQPFARGANAIMMEFVGDATTAAPILHSVRLPRHEARRLFREAIDNVDLMLGEGMIHGDLSAFNILYWEGRITLIDFPQVTMAHSNHRAYEVFQRDVLRVCQYFQRQGVESDPVEIAERMWERQGGATSPRGHHSGIAAPRVSEHLDQFASGRSVRSRSRSTQ
jgi:RIO kinase 1